MDAILHLFSSSWFWADAFLACIGGAIVFIGLRIERAAEEYKLPEEYHELFEELFAMKFGNTNEVPDVYIVSYSTNDIFHLSSAGVALEKIGNIARPVTSETNETAVLYGLYLCFGQIRVTVAGFGSDDMVQPGHCLIWIPVK